MILSFRDDSALLQLPCSYTPHLQVQQTNRQPLTTARPFSNHALFIPLIYIGFTPVSIICSLSRRLSIFAWLKMIYLQHAFEYEPKILSRSRSTYQPIPTSKPSPCYFSHQSMQLCHSQSASPLRSRAMYHASGYVDGDQTHLHAANDHPYQPDPLPTRTADAGPQ
jgi:hypothetical protein